MQPHQERVVAESNELRDRLNKLSSFVNSDAFDALPDENQTLLVRQERIMGEYLETLRERIARFS